MISAEELRSRLDRLAKEHHVTGAAAAVAVGEEVVTAHLGCANLATSMPVRHDTLFAAGSVTKVFTVALVMTLVDDGLVDLDAPVQRYLPDFRLADVEASKHVTVRMLLNHTAGIPGHCMYDLPRSPEVVARHLEVMRELPFTSPPGRFWSYSNGGMAVAGRVAEVVSGRTWDEALAERILGPLGGNATTSAEELVLGSTAVGHLVGPSGAVTRVPRLVVDSGNGPAGATLWCDIDAMIAFGQMHLREGRSADGKTVLSPESVALMQAPSLETLWGLPFENWGLGWYIRGTGAARTLGHTGGNAGAHSILTIAPEHGCAVAVLTNSTTGAVLNALLTEELFQQLCGISAAPRMETTGDPVTAGLDLDRYAGTYEAEGGSLTVTVRNDRLHVEQHMNDSLAGHMTMISPDLLPLPPMTLTPFDADGRFLSDAGMPVSFVDGASYVCAGRIFRRVSAAM
ncbi:CubicO group peptidase (beta-lactamase class C family) [Amycolatopsis bartoniae]|uniref:Serine hydrolase n=1 Tax=Amycolatopsis bartoniae TaxID=941986 RepID=A0A8H9IZ15_9PSEU|nr:serine hydrolase [Amycolatopsis bartoniae]MBB2936589.1 CubicO group peptidase (beta-lactamase class C family) [Amycolatopsis bartoniae]GHF67851.1 serine hydrolase [Amycolatopsis bartoniae]